MKFDKHYKVITETLNRDEAEAFLEFLKDEMGRHEDEVCKSFETIDCLEEDISKKAEALIRFWGSQAKRHAEDIENIKALTQQVKERFNL